MSAAPRAGWYPDPGGRSDAYRWWDGDDWTGHVSDVPNAPEPAASDPDPDRQRSPLRRAVALILVLALVASAGAGVGLWLWRDEQAPTETRSGAGRVQSSPSGSPSAPVGRLDQRTRQATIAQVTMTLPDGPYVLQDDPWSVGGLFDTAFVAEAPVHSGYAPGRTWSAIVALALLDPDLVGTDLNTDTDTAVAQLAARLYGKQPTKVSGLEIDVQSVDGYPGMMATGEVHYEIKGLPSRHDDVAAHLIRLEDGVVVVALMSVPDDADPEVLEQARAALSTLQAS